MRKCNLRRKAEKSIINRNRKRLKRINKMKKKLSGASKGQEKKLIGVLDSLKKWAI